MFDRAAGAEAALIHLGLLLGVARELEWHNAWLCGGLLLLLKIASATLLTRLNPRVIDARGTKQPLSRRERIFFAFYVSSTFSLPIIAALDVGAAGWTHHSSVELALGMALVVLGSAGIVWALAVFVRHPGYVAAAVVYTGLPLMLGSYWCYVPVVVLGVALVIRTRYEDRLLRAELDGYEDYAAETRYRLLPEVL